MHRWRLGILGGVAVALTVAGLTAARPFDAGLASATGPQTTSVAGPSASASPTASPSPRTSAAPSTTTPSRAAAASADSLSLRLVTYNTLGSLHTEPGGDMEYRAPAELRAQLGADVLRQQHPDIVGFQELRPNQIAAFQREFPTFSIWSDYGPGNIGRPTGIMWDNSELAKVDGSYLDIPSLGATRRMSYVLLEHRATGRRFYYLNVHNSPGTGRQAERDEDLRRETAKINELRATGLPVFMSGDMNEHEHAVCTVLAQTDLVASAGGSYADGVCTPPARMRIDWIFGSATFSDHVFLQPPLVGRATDHTIVAATATLN